MEVERLKAAGAALAASRGCLVPTPGRCQRLGAARLSPPEQIGRSLKRHPHARIQAAIVRIRRRIAPLANPRRSPDLGERPGPAAATRA